MPSNTNPGRNLTLTLHADAVAAPAHNAARMCREVVDLYFGALAKADLSEPPPASQEAFFRFSITGPGITADERRSAHENWILAKAFQDLMRGVRGSLEKAYLFVQLHSIGHMQVATNTTIDELLAPFQKKARVTNFPDLLGKLNQKFATPVAFSQEYASMQSAALVST
ncbi:hypothetical protein JQ600_28395 [Bradyrhizobium sp. AUGA SZCCT0176]|uniref:hypothetical protein n=1 Tax=Bradyrhizobium sp. AUGA SZCCT0176 TaxID=2807664 RepID=UPI001BA74F4A|nr:hypothetical protein [Bradyrhizobium sp. AUGA SZCCT0176]MBR1228809.1 hypothetical protein [Bradyrhizobium sp. AUGA SZCCT0176]